MSFMKSLLISLLLLATPAFADDVQSVQYNASVGRFQGTTRANGSRDFVTLSADGTLSGLKFVTTGGTPATCTDYEKGSFSAAFTGPRSATTTINFVRMCDIVTLHIQRNKDAACSVATGFNATGAIPSRIRSTFGAIGQSLYPIPVQDNSTSPTSFGGTIGVTSTGTIFIDRTFSSSAFTASGNCGWWETSFSYPIY